MRLQELAAFARDKANFLDLASYVDFSQRYLEFASTGLQATIVSQNENHYRFLQYKEEGYFNTSRPINSRLMYDAEEAAVLTEGDRLCQDIQQRPD